MKMETLLAHQEALEGENKLQASLTKQEKKSILSKTHIKLRR